jgi:N-acetylmuramoyl-L-alanine amidase
MDIQQMLLTPNKYSRPQNKLTDVKGIVIHYVGNAGSKAVANRNYFESLKDTGKTYGKYIIGGCFFMLLIVIVKIHQ